MYEEMISMKNTIKTIEERYKEDLKAQDERNEEIQKTESQLADLKAKLEEAKRNGDIEIFKTTKEDIRDLEDVLEVLRSMNTHKSFTPVDVSEAWDNFRSGYDKEYDRIEGDCKKKMHEFAEAYKKLLMHQNYGLSVQNMLADMAGIEKVDGISGQVDYPDLPLRYIPEKAAVHVPNNSRVETPEVLFLVGSGIWKLDQGAVLNGEYDALQTAWSILHLHKTVPEVNL